MLEPIVDDRYIQHARVTRDRRRYCLKCPNRHNAFHMLGICCKMNKGIFRAFLIKFVQRVVGAIASSKFVPSCRPSRIQLKDSRNAYPSPTSSHAKAKLTQRSSCQHPRQNFLPVRSDSALSSAASPQSPPPSPSRADLSAPVTSSP